MTWWRRLGFVACLLGLSLAGCSGGPNAAITGPTTVTFWHASKGAAADLLAQLADEFHQANPDITINLVFGGDAAKIAADLPGAVSSGLGPQMAEVPGESLAGLRASGTLRPLDSFIASQAYGLEIKDLDDFWSCFVGENTIGRQVWGLPWSHRIYALVYDRAVVANPPATWDTLKATASAFTRRGDDPALAVFGLAFQANTDLFTLFLYQNGGQLFSGDPPRMAFSSPQGTGALDYLAEITTLRKAALLTVGDPTQAVLDGRAVMAVALVGWPEGELPGGQVTLAQLPTGQARATLAPGSSLVLTAGHDAAEEEAAWLFTRFLTGKEISGRWAAATGVLPVRRSSLDTPAWREGPGLVRGMGAVLAQMDAVVVIPATADTAWVRAEFDAVIEPWLLGRINSSQALLDGVVEKVTRAAGGQ